MNELFIIDFLEKYIERERSKLQFHEVEELKEAIKYLEYKYEQRT